MAFILPLLYFICFTETLMIFFKKKFEKVLPLTFFISAITLYLSGLLFKNFYIGFIICIIFSLIFPIYLIKNRKNIKIKDYFSSGFMIFILIYLLIYILDFNRFFTRWDELSHWGKMVKEMIKINDFYSQNNSNLLVHKDYPPIMSLIELFYVFLCGKFKEVYLIRCMHLFESSLIISIIPLKSNSKKKSIITTLLTLLFMYFLTFLFDSAIVINSIYTDIALSLLTSYILYNIFKMDKLDNYNLINIIISTIVLLLFKQLSIAFYLMILFLIFFKMIIRKEPKYLKLFLLLLIIPLIFMFSWNKYINNLNIKGQFEVSSIMNDMTNSKTIISSDNYQKTTLINYLNALFGKSIINSNYTISYISMGILLLFLVIMLFIKIKDKINKKEYILTIITLIIGYFGFIVLMLILYLYSFNEIESVSLASYERYMSTYILIVLYMLIYMYLDYIEIKKENIKKYIIVLFIILFMIKPISYVKLRPDLILLNNHYYDSYRSAVNVIDNHVNNMDKVFIVDQKEQDGAVFYINYFSNKVSTNLLHYDLTMNSSNKEMYFNNNYKEYMENYDYLYIYLINDTFIDDYKFLSNNKLKENTLYKIVKNNTNIYLEEIK